MLDDGFMKFMGYRNMVVEEKIDECLSQVRRGETKISMDAGDLSNDEIEYVKKEVRRRASKYC